MSSTIYTLGDDAAKDLADQGFVVVDGRKLKDNSTTIYRIQSKSKQPIVLQFGKQWSSRVNGNYVRFKADKNNTRNNNNKEEQDICFVNAEEDPTMRKDLEEIVKLVGKTLFRSKEAYWQGRCDDKMGFDQFMKLRSTNIKANSVTSNMEFTLKAQPWSKFLKVDAIENDSGNFKLEVEGRIKEFQATSTPFEGLVSTLVNVYVGFNGQSPSWGIYLTVRDAYFKPVPRKRKERQVSIKVEDCDEIVMNYNDVVIEDPRNASEDDRFAPGFTPPTPPPIKRSRKN